MKFLQEHKRRHFVYSHLPYFFFVGLEHHSNCLRVFSLSFLYPIVRTHRAIDDPADVALYVARYALAFETAGFRQDVIAAKGEWYDVFFTQSFRAAIRTAIDTAANDRKDMPIRSGLGIACHDN